MFRPRLGVCCRSSWSYHGQLGRGRVTALRAIGLPKQRTRKPCGRVSCLYIYCAPDACLVQAHHYLNGMEKTEPLQPEHISEIVQMALSDHISFADIKREYGLDEARVKALMRDTLKTGSYKAWRRRVRDFGDRRAHYK